MFAWHQLLEQPRRPRSVDTQKGSYLGPSYSSAEICAFLDGIGAKYRRPASQTEFIDQVVGLLEQEKIVGWFQGRMEFGPRALGARSIIGDPRSPKMQATMNLKIKFRESFRPFAPIVLREEASKWFGIDAKHESPYMLLVAPVRDEQRIPITDAQRETMKQRPGPAESRQRAPVHDSGRDARRLQRATADGR